MTPHIRMTLLGVAALLLLGLIVVPLFSALVPAPPIAAESGRKTDMPAPASASAAERDRWVEQALARPPFRADRKPEAAVGTAAAAGAPLPRLTGITLSPDGNTALFQPEGGKPVLVAEGGAIAGWTVRTIAARRVTLVRDDGERELTLGPPPPQSRHRPS